MPRPFSIGREIFGFALARSSFVHNDSPLTMDATPQTNSASCSAAAAAVPRAARMVGDAGWIRSAVTFDAGAPSFVGRRVGLPGLANNSRGRLELV